jgi:shikimate dehydrogenase
MKRACVIGWPITQSRSPLIHGYWLNQLGIDGSYAKVAVEPDGAERFLYALAEEGFAGCNVTVPHKEAAYRVADWKDPSAIAVGAANTVWLEDGRICCANTDTYGFMTYLATRAPNWPRPEASVSVLGAGGASRAIVYGLLEAGANTVRVFNRSLARSRNLAAYFAALGDGRVEACDWSDRNRLSANASLLVNTTSVGMNDDGDLGIDMMQLSRDCVVADIVYVPLQTKLLRQAQQAGLTTVDGLGMLLHQAVPGFERWFGQRPAVTRELYDLVAADVEGR